MSAQAVLSILKEGEVLREVPLGESQEVTVGRAEGCQVRLVDRAISRRHALFRFSSEGVQVEKHSQFAPIQWNGAECTRALLKNGDFVVIGPYSMKVTITKPEKLKLVQAIQGESP